MIVYAQKQSFWHHENKKDFHGINGFLGYQVTKLLVQESIDSSYQKFRSARRVPLWGKERGAPLGVHLAGALNPVKIFRKTLFF